MLSTRFVNARRSVFCLMRPKERSSRLPDSAEANDPTAANAGAHEPHSDWQLCDSPRTYVLAPGEYSFLVQAVDKAGNVGRSKVPTG